MKNVRRDRYGFRAYVKVGREQEEKRYKPGTSLKTMQDWIDETRVALKKLPQTPATKSTLKAAALDYLKKEEIKGLLSFKSRQCEIWAWVELYGQVSRASLTRQHVVDARDRWLADGKAPKTINHRVRALRHLYRVLDGVKAATPCDDVGKLKEPDADPRFVPVAVINRVLKKIADPQTRARFMVLVATGQRPAQLKRALRTDINLRLRLWQVRPAKGGNPIPIPLTDDMIVAWKTFIAADAFDDQGVCRPFDGSDYAKQLYAAGWNKARFGRPYNAKHTIAITLGESDAEWEDIKDWFGHTDLKTTRIYTGLITKRLKGTAKLLDGRLGWTASGLPAASGGVRRNATESGANSRTRKRA